MYNQGCQAIDGLVYGEIFKENKEIKEVHGNVESHYKDGIDIVEKKMKD